MMGPDEHSLGVMIQAGNEVAPGLEVEVSRLSDAVENAKYMANAFPGTRYNVYKLVATHTFKGL